MPDTRSSGSRWEVRKAVIPAAGFGTRLGPITQTVPKEMFPVAGRAIIEYTVEEALRSGIQCIGIIIRAGKEIIRDHLLKVFSPRDIHLVFIDQVEPLGLGHAIMTCRGFALGEAVAVLLPDMLFQTTDTPMRELLSFFSETGKSCFALVPVPAESAHRYGTLKGICLRDGIYKITYIANEFQPGVAFSSPEMRGCGRMIIAPRAFDYLPRPDRELSDGELMRWLIGVDEVFGIQVPYTAYDTGSYDGYIAALSAFPGSASPNRNQHEGEATQ